MPTLVAILERGMYHCAAARTTQMGIIMMS